MPGRGYAKEGGLIEIGADKGITVNSLAQISPSLHRSASGKVKVNSLSLGDIFFRLYIMTLGDLASSPKKFVVENMFTIPTL